MIYFIKALLNIETWACALFPPKEQHVRSFFFQSNRQGDLNSVCSQPQKLLSGWQPVIAVSFNIAVASALSKWQNCMCVCKTQHTPRYRKNSMYWDRLVSANSADQDQTASEEAV